MFSLMSLKSKSSTSSRSGGYDSVAVRLAGPEDEAAIRRLASLDSKKVLGGPHLVAEADGDVIAALAIASDHAVSDPFRWTADVVELMKIRAAQLRAVPADATVAAAGSGVAQLRTQLT
jgi:predicted ATP-grasp superfamily ATP-dependent carboligase